MLTISIHVLLLQYISASKNSSLEWIYTNVWLSSSALGVQWDCLTLGITRAHKPEIKNWQHRWMPKMPQLKRSLQSTWIWSRFQQYVYGCNQAWPKPKGCLGSQIAATSHTASPLILPSNKAEGERGGPFLLGQWQPRLPPVILEKERGEGV